MFLPEAQIQIHLYGQPTDLRKSFDGLQHLICANPDWNPMSGQLFVFINRSATQMKVLYWDRTGYCVWAKRLEAGRFIKNWDDVKRRSMDFMSFKLMLEGLEIIQKSKRYNHANAMKKLEKKYGIR